MGWLPEVQVDNKDNFGVHGAIAGISGCIAYAKVYHNYNAATWAAVSAAFAIIFLRLNFSVRRDHERLITIETFTAFMWVGIVGLIAGLIAFITYIVLGATHHEHGLKADGYYVVCIWSFKTLIWGVFTLMSARKFRKKYFEAFPGLVQERVI
ncbi:hypothetical protein OS493_028812 [Desmophyllum pertusum]|uniref:Uncharacterized protein n=1 Tax=Desmophyllum pertusum TaxID=174260 RepID=A0A9W9ZZ95_9CNID|nr:hypothetical protein OS493_028812 [Desmophyllum pertusum]